MPALLCTTGLCLGVDCVVTIAGTMGRLWLSNVDRLAVRLLSRALLLPRDGSAVTLYVVVIVSPFVIELLLLRGPETSRREEGMT